jgi:hypothetical protein
VIDIFDDTVDRNVSGSDAVECSRIMGCPNGGKGCGICWLVISLTCFIGK